MTKSVRCTKFAFSIWSLLRSRSLTQTENQNWQRSLPPSLAVVINFKTANRSIDGIDWPDHCWETSVSKLTLLSQNALRKINLSNFNFDFQSSMVVVFYYEIIIESFYFWFSFFYFHCDNCDAGRTHCVKQVSDLSFDKATARRSHSLWT